MNNNHPTISIIVPVYNVEEYLPHCLKSIQNQTFTDYECILIDDGSTDSSGKICDEFCTTDKRFKVIHQENQGYRTARNTGLDICQGDYISFIDADDYIHPIFLQTLHSAISRNNSPLAMVYGKRVHDHNETSDITSKESIELSQASLMERLFASSEIDLQYQVVWNKMYSKDLINDIRFRQTASEDTFFNMQIFIQTEKAILIESELYYWFQHSSSITHQGINLRFIDVLKTYNDLYQIIPSSYQQYRGYCLYKLYKRLLSIRYYAYPTEHKAYAKKIITEVRKDTWNDFLKNRSIKLSQKFIIMAFWHIPALYRAFMWYCEHKK